MAGSNDVLARKYVEFAMRGQGSIQAAMRNISKELTNAKGRAQLLNKHLADGTYQKAANQLAAIRRQYQQMQQAARFQDLVAEHGRFGASLQIIQERMAGLTRAAGWGFGMLTATTMGWVTAGMQGTVEAYRLQMGFTQLSREIASVFKPTIDDVTNAVYRAARWFQGLSGEQQSTIRTTVLWTAGLLGGILVVNMTVKAVAALRAGLIATAAAMKSVGAASTLMFGMSGWKGMLALGAVGAGIYALNEATSGPTESPEDRGVVEKTGNLVSRGLGSTWDALRWNFVGDEGRNRIRRQEKLRVLESREEWGNMKPGDKEELERLRKEGKGKRSDVSLNQTGFEQIGAGWDRMANEVLKMSDPAERAAGALETIVAMLNQWKSSGGMEGNSIADFLSKTLREKGF